MTEHEKIRELLALVAAGALTTAEETRIAEHVRSCIDCSSQLEVWRSLVTDLYRLPAPEPSPRLVQATVALAMPKLAARAEHHWNGVVMTFVVAYAWLLLFASWPLFRFASSNFGNLLGPRFGQPWISFAAFALLGWLAGGVAGAILAIWPPPERRLA